MNDCLDFSDYQYEAYQFARYKSAHYPYLALGEECGEVQGLVAKSLRKHGNLSGVNKYELEKELGDVLWNIAAIATEFSLDLEEIAEKNLKKLQARKAAGTIVER